MNFNELADRVEQLTGPDRSVDKLVFAALFPDKVPSPIVKSGYGWREEKDHWWCETGEDSRCPRKTISPQQYTASLDAALTLLPQHHHWSLSVDPEAGFANAGYAGASVFQKDGNDVFHAESITPALALLAAILRAKAVG